MLQKCDSLRDFCIFLFQIWEEVKTNQHSCEMSNSSLIANLRQHLFILKVARMGPVKVTHTWLDEFRRAEVSLAEDWMLQLKMSLLIKANFVN